MHLDKHGSDPTNVREALGKHFRTGNVKQVFQELDEDGSGFLDRAECEKAAETLSEKLGFEMSQDDLDEAFAQMDKDGDGEIMLEEFSAWWKGFTSTKKELKVKQMEQMEAAGLLEASPKPKELQLTLKVILKLLPTMGLRLRTFEVLEDMCPDDAVFDSLQEACKCSRSLCVFFRRSSKQRLHRQPLRAEALHDQR